MTSDYRKNILYTILAILGLCSCNGPKAAFSVSATSDRAPSTLLLKEGEKSRGFTEWRINGEKILLKPGGLLLAQSGHYDITLVKESEGKKDSLTKKFVLGPPETHCLVEIWTSVGTMVAELSPLAPIHSDHLEALIEHGYYDSLYFHRIVPGFVVQGGDGKTAPKGYRRLPKGYKEELPAEFHEELLHYRGALAMARIPDEANPERKSSPDQFYIVVGAPMNEEKMEQFETDSGAQYTEFQKQRYYQSGGSPQLDGAYTVFGYIIEGQEVLDKIVEKSFENRAEKEEVYMRLKMVE